jgi:alcohol dehydrogenase (cytochrome c)
MASSTAVNERWRSLPRATGTSSLSIRLTGEHLITSKFSASANWAEPALNARGQPVRIPAKDHHIAGALVSNANQGAANWPPPSFSPKTGLF